MAISSSDLAAIARAVWTADGIIPSPQGNKANPFWQAQRVLADLGTQVRTIEAAIAALAAGSGPPSSSGIAAVLAGLDPTALADAIATNLGPETGQQVVTALQARLAAPPPAG
jgi:hypothetical protein